MNIKELINKTNDELQDLERKNKKYDSFLNPFGQDRVVSSLDIQSELETQRLTQEKPFLSKLPKMDFLTEGFSSEELVVVSAPTRHGKTSFCQTLTENFESQGISCLWFEFEVGMNSFFKKFHKQIPTFYLPRKMKHNDLVWLEERIYQGIANYGTKVVFIDHLHYVIDLVNKKGGGDSFSLSVGFVMRELRRMAIEHGITVFLIAHMKKLFLDKPPELDDLRDSSFIAQEADIVLLMSRHSERDLDGTRGKRMLTNEVSVSVEKSRRSGKSGSVKLMYKDNYHYEIDEHHEQ